MFHAPKLLLNYLFDSSFGVVTLMFHFIYKVILWLCSICLVIRKLLAMY